MPTSLGYVRAGLTYPAIRDDATGAVWLFKTREEALATARARNAGEPSIVDGEPSASMAASFVSDETPYLDLEGD